MEGSIIQVDIGHRGGLQRGDVGIVYFEVANGNDLLTVEVGSGRVVETTDRSAAVQVDRNAVVEPGHLVRFEIPELRLVRPTPRRQAESRPPPSSSTAYVAHSVTPCLNVRPLPAQFSTPLDCLPAGVRVDIVDSAPGWKRVRLPSGDAGWVAERFLESQPGSAAPPPIRTPPPAPQEDDLDLMRQRVERTQEALEVSEAARADLRRRLDEAVDAEAKAGLRADLEESITQLDRVRTYHLRLKSTLTRRILSSTIANLEEQLRLTAGDLQRAAAERDRLSAEVAALRSTTSSEDSTNLADAERRRIEAEQRAIAAEARNAELEVELEYAASRISGLGGDSESPNIDRTEIERAPAIEAPLVNSELRLQQGSEPPPATPAATSTDLSDAAGRSAADSAARSAAAAIPEVRSEATGPATQVEEIAWQEDDGSIVFYISLDGRVSKEDCNVVRVRSGVPRDVLKVQGLRKNLSPSMIDVQTGSVVRLRTGVHRSGDQSEMHIVVDLTHADAAIRTVRIRGNILVVTIN